MFPNVFTKVRRGNTAYLRRIIVLSPGKCAEFSKRVFVKIKISLKALSKLLARKQENKW